MSSNDCANNVDRSLKVLQSTCRDYGDKKFYGILKWLISFSKNLQVMCQQRVKTVIRSIGGPVFDPMVANPKFSKILIPCSSVSAEQEKDPTHGVNAQHVVAWRNWAYPALFFVVGSVGIVQWLSFVALDLATCLFTSFQKCFGKVGWDCNLQCNKLKCYIYIYVYIYSHGQ